MTTYVTLRLVFGAVAVAMMLLVVVAFRGSASPTRMVQSLPRLAREVVAHAIHFVLGPRRTPAWAMRLIVEPGPLSPAERMRVALMIAHVKGTLRIGWWDMGAILWAFYHDGQAMSTLQAVVVNVTLAVMAIVGTFFALTSHHHLIPEEERANWNMWTAAFYPLRLLRSRSTIRRATEDKADPLSACRHQLANVIVERDGLARRVAAYIADPNDPHARAMMVAAANAALGHGETPHRP